MTKPLTSVVFRRACNETHHRGYDAWFEFLQVRDIEGYSSDHRQTLLEVTIMEWHGEGNKCKSAWRWEISFIQ